MRLVFACFALTLAALPARAQSDAARRALEVFHATRPADADLGMYRLDWEPALPDALARAKAEHKPLCLVIIHAKYGDLFSGHC